MDIDKLNLINVETKQVKLKFIKVSTKFSFLCVVMCFYVYWLIESFDEISLKELNKKRFDRFSFNIAGEDTYTQGCPI